MKHRLPCYIVAINFVIIISITWFSSLFPLQSKTCLFLENKQTNSKKTHLQNTISLCWPSYYIPLGQILSYSMGVILALSNCNEIYLIDNRKVCFWIGINTRHFIFYWCFTNIHHFVFQWGGDIFLNDYRGLSRFKYKPKIIALAIKEDIDVIWFTNRNRPL